MNVLRNNNFDLLRLLLAMTVLFVHASRLTNSPSLQFLDDFLSSEAAVHLFFIVSGFLIFQSYERSSSIWSYTDKRIRRVYPAYAVVIFLSSFLFFFLSDTSAEKYFSMDLLKYLFSNLIFLNFLCPTLPGVFSDNAASAVNGALWTLKIEVMFYLSVPLCVWLIRWKGAFLSLLMLYIASFLYIEILSLYSHRQGGGIIAELQRQLPGQFSLFAAGAALFYYFDFFKRYALFLLVPSLLILTFCFDALAFLYPASLAIVLFIFVFKVPYLGDFSKYGDFSYGIYIVHFPVLQGLISLGVFRINPFLGLLITILSVVLLSYLSWHMVESRFLKARREKV